MLINSLKTKLIPDFFCGRIILTLLLAFMLGIVIGQHLSVAWMGILLLGLLAIILPIVASALRKMHFLLLLPAVIVFGMFMASGENTRLDAWSFEDGQSLTISGEIKRVEPDDDHWRAQIEIATVEGEELDCADIYLYGKGSVPRVGSIIEAQGEVFSPRPDANANAFDYYQYLRQQGIAGSMSTLFGGSFTVLQPGPAFYPGLIGEWLQSGLDQAMSGLSDQQQALIKGVFLGDKSGLDYQMKNALGLAGALHAFAVSGLHVGFIVALAFILAGSGYRRRFIRFGLCLFLLLIYLSLTGLSASVLRASIMAICLLVATLFDEQNDNVTALSFAAILCLFIHPLWLFSAGFQLSFMAVTGIIVLSPVFIKLLNPLPKAVKNFFAISFSASLATLPLISYYFYHISWLGWLFSPLVILAAAITVILSFFATLIAIFSPTIAAFLLQGAAWVIEQVYLLNLAVSDSTITATITGATPAWAVILCLIALAFIPVIAARFSKLLTWGAMIVIVAAFTFLAPKCNFPEHSLDGEVAEIVFIDVGQGDCSLIIAPDGQTVLIDGGGEPWAPGAIGEYTLLPYLKSRGISQIDLMISSHPDSDHTDGLLSVIEHLQVDTLAMADIWQGNELADQLTNLAEENNAEILDVRAGDEITLADNLVISFYHPQEDLKTGEVIIDDENDQSLICEMSYGEIDILYTGDISGDLLSEICDENALEAEIIKVPHHGSSTGYHPDLALQLEASEAIICVGEDNYYGHPTAKVIEYWQEYGEIYRTDTDGSITVFTNGNQYQISTYY